MSNDRSLLEAAARAAGIEIATWSNCQAGGFLSISCMPDRRERFWNPLADDGDALRLAVTLKMKITPIPEAISVETSGVLEYVLRQETDDAAATRRAIVLCAAAMAPAKGRAR